ncbi:MAG: hypothetical protein FXF47_01730 [Candidatus Mcinerneyibacterium aminivorans]|uniref:GRAM domain-containing protein n=1 Tax=Candidatus Mcinerneyibacterium aminivorans TaxID=2703815 RepID=A0A5D0MFU3_9BACT|nr:MAG: hypothetical protein FXF47_01730 [Candidatus Mcinerneyibacterium aminivorans]
MEFFFIALIGVVLVFVIVIRYVGNRRINEVKEKLGEDNIVYMGQANFLGILSKGKQQKSGNGVLALTDELLFFKSWYPGKEYKIKIDDIRNVEQVNKFLGKAKLKLLLKVSYRNSEEGEDSAAWLVGDIDTWSDNIRKLVE